MITVFYAAACIFFSYVLVKSSVELWRVEGNLLDKLYLVISSGTALAFSFFALFETLF
jgi:hypothetical protein